jgi:flagellar motor switch protein FliN/FliY
MTAPPLAGSDTLARVAAAAAAAVPLLPAVDPLVAGEPTTSPDGPELAELAGKGVLASFSGAAKGQIFVAVGQDLVDALEQSSMGALELTQALQPIAEAAAATLGAVVVEAGIAVPDLRAGLSALAAAGDAAFAPLTDGTGVRAIIGLLITDETAVREPGATSQSPVIRHGLDLLHGVEMDVTAELGQTRMTVRELLSLSPGSIVELDRLAGSPADLLVNGRMIGRGEVVVIDENFGIRITEIASPDDERGPGTS